MCMCTNKSPNCNITNLSLSIYLGETISIPLVAVGQRNSVQLAHAITKLLHVTGQRTLGKINYIESIQNVQKSCKNLNYTVMLLNLEEKLSITACA